MEELIVLGTGNALCTNCYNTCFAIRNQNRVVLVDAGGGNTILARLEQAKVNFADIHDIIVTHEHCDHILGMVWMVRKIATLIKNGSYEGNLTIYCHSGLVEPIKAMCGFTLQKKFTSLFDDRILFDVIEDGSPRKLAGWDFTFFDILSTKAKQFGFTMMLDSGKKLCCLGDEPYNPNCQQYVEGSSWLLSEAFCLYGDRERFKPYEKHHSTVKEACELATQLGVENLVLWHTEDKSYATRKETYTAEGREYYQGNLFVPYDLEVLEL